MHFKFFHIDNQAKRTLFLLHGTGADEHDLLPIVEPFHDQYNIVSLRGNVEKFGIRRFFALREIGGGFTRDNFDQDSIEEETGKLAEFVREWKKSHEINDTGFSFLGYSNGANMILATLFRHPAAINRAVLLHPMLPLAPTDLDLSGKEFLVTYGENDQLISADESKEVVKVLKNCGAKVQIVSHPGGHELRAEELEGIQNFLARHRA